jgi:hypothetical protein
VKGQFEDFVDATTDMRTLAKKCRDYKDGNQYTAEERETLKKRKQPIITDNKVQDKVDTLMGLEKQYRTDPKAFPRTPKHEQAAEAATDALRYVADSCDYQRSARKPATENLIVEGWCYGEVYWDKKKRQICMEHIRVDRGYHDIRSLRPDFQDKEYCGYFTWMDADVVKRMFKGKESIVDGSFSDVSGTDKEHEDKPNRYVELRSGRQRLQVFTHYHKKDGVWTYSRWCKGGFLEEPRPSSYVDENGEPTCNIEVQALYRDSDGNCYGAVPRYLDLQDEHNKRRSKMLHLLNSKRLIAQKGAFEDVNKARAELHKPDMVLEPNANIDQVRVEDNLAAADGQWRLMMQTNEALSQTGPSASVMSPGGSSGRSKEIDQAAGTLPLLPIFDAVDAWEIRMYRLTWMCVRQFWRAPMWIRVTDNEDSLKFVGLNQPMTQGEVAAQQLKQQPIPDEEKQAALQQIAADPNAQTPAIGPNGPVVDNAVAEMDVDIIISRSADTVNIQAEQFEILASIAEKRPEIPFDVLVDMSQLRSETKKLIRDKLTGQNDPGAQKMAQMQELMGQLEMRLKAAEGSLKEAQTEKTQAETAQIQTQTVATGIDAAGKLVSAADPPKQAIN